MQSVMAKNEIYLVERLRIGSNLLIVLRLGLLMLGHPYFTRKHLLSILYFSLKLKIILIEFSCVNNKFFLMVLVRASSLVRGVLAMCTSFYKW